MSCLHLFALVILATCGFFCAVHANMEDPDNTLSRSLQQLYAGDPSNSLLRSHGSFDRDLDWILGHRSQPSKRLSEFLGGPGKRYSEFLGGPGKRYSEFLGGPGKRYSEFLGGPGKRYSEFLGGPGKRYSEFLGGPGKRYSEFLGGPGKRSVPDDLMAAERGLFRSPSSSAEQQEPTVPGALRK
ncbi:uncharacterized protein LOC144153823 isoform X1 [Haemaphysalis longicornis]